VAWQPGQAVDVVDIPVERRGGHWPTYSIDPLWPTRVGPPTRWGSDHRTPNPKDDGSSELLRFERQRRCWRELPGSDRWVVLTSSLDATFNMCIK
jgi:hypothetical protein